MKKETKNFFSEIREWILSDVLDTEEKKAKIFAKRKENPVVFEKALLLRDKNDRYVSLLDLAVIIDDQILINSLLYFSPMETREKRKNTNDIIINREIGIKTKPEKYARSIFEHIGENHYNILHWSALLGNISIIDKAVFAGVNLNQLGENGETALYFAVRKQRLEVVHKLLIYGADVNLGILENSHGFSACLSEAAKNRDFLMVKMLLSFGAFIDGKDSKGLTALCYAVENVDLPIAEYLLSNNANSLARNAEGHNLIEILYSRHLEDHNGKLEIEREKIRKSLISKMEKQSSFCEKPKVFPLLNAPKKRNIPKENNAKNIKIFAEEATISSGENPISNKIVTKVRKNLFGREER